MMPGENLPGERKGWRPSSRDASRDLEWSQASDECPYRTDSDLDRQTDRQTHARQQHSHTSAHCSIQWRGMYV